MNKNNNKVRDTAQKQFDAQGVMALRVRDDSGNIRVTSGDDTNEIALRAEKIVEGDASVAELQTNLDRVKASIHMEGDTFVVRADYPREEFSRKRIHVTINYDITIPQCLALDLLSHSGNVEVKGGIGGIQAHSDSGNVILTDIFGTVEATTSSGDVSVQGATVTDSLQLDSSSGNVRAKAIRVSGSAPKVRLKSSSGNVEFEGEAGELDLHASSGNVTGQVTSALTLSQANLHASSGNVTLSAPKSLSATIHAKTSSGNIQMHGLSDAHGNSNLDAGDTGRSRKFTMGSGSAAVTLEASSGNVAFIAR